MSLYHFLQWVQGSGKDIEPPVQREAKTQDGMALGSGHCSARWAVPGAQGSAGAPAAAGLVFHSIAECYEEPWTRGLSTRLVPSAFHQVPAASSQAVHESHVRVAAGESGSCLRVSRLNPTPPWLAGHPRPKTKGQLRTRS